MGPPDRATSAQSTAGSDGHGDSVIAARSHAALTAVAEAVSRLRYGAVHLTIHDGRVVQLDVTERQRFT
ncbi:hypothetical protein B2G71_07285 [Novosphingobium sp. PC22D]|uniref:YezD family protein n=1 Tax=Novosphingobium sp. PC22D TaxID=1962403 RepID=UPI000BEFB945|nr:YezD family protein [Novosphingobium sp. PC22D]PEQ13236.1 hypothetical protein B2G71_07285 [Novosphingobium sp. PC22D]